MSRMQVGAFLSKAKKQLQTALQNKGSISFVIGNESADLDSIAGSIVYGYIQSSTPQALSQNKTIVPITNIPAADLALRPELTALLKHADLKPSDLITLDDLGTPPLSLNKTEWTLVDHNVFQGELGKCYANDVIGVIDHHDDENKVSKIVVPRLIEKTGSCCSHIANYCRDAWDSTEVLSSRVGVGYGQNDILIDDFAYSSTWDSQVAKLALGAILVDTINLKAEHKVTPHDQKAVRYLEARINISPKHGKDYNRDRFYNQINDAKDDVTGLSVYDLFRRDYKQWSENNMQLGISSSVKSLGFVKDLSEDFLGDLQSFVKERKLDLFAIMTAFSDDKDQFTRELLLFVPEQGNARDVAEKFADVTKEELELEDITSALSIQDSSAWLRVWNQRNLKASRKRVGPLLRENMR